METKKTRYGMTTTIEGPFAEAVERVKRVFLEHGLGTMTEVDIRAKIKDKLGEEIEPYTVLGVCNIQFALRAIKIEHEVGLLIPCRVLVHECGGSVSVSVLDPYRMFEAAENDGLNPIAQEATDCISAAMAALGKA
jgi:uncharacterized protein (DUF302 family)